MRYLALFLLTALLGTSVLLGVRAYHSTSAVDVTLTLQPVVELVVTQPERWFEIDASQEEPHKTNIGDRVDVIACERLASGSHAYYVAEHCQVIRVIPKEDEKWAPPGIRVRVVVKVASNQQERLSEAMVNHAEFVLVKGR